MSVKLKVLGIACLIVSAILPIDPQLKAAGCLIGVLLIGIGIVLGQEETTIK